MSIRDLASRAARRLLGWPPDARPGLCRCVHLRQAHDPAGRCETCGCRRYRRMRLVDAMLVGIAEHGPVSERDPRYVQRMDGGRGTLGRAWPAPDSSFVDDDPVTEAYWAGLATWRAQGVGPWSTWPEADQLDQHWPTGHRDEPE